MITSDRLPPPGFIHVDLDGLWTLAGAYGYPEGRSFHDDPVWQEALPRLLDLLAARGIRATFFLIGRDLDLEPKRAGAAAIVAAGHAVANHTQSHRLDLELLDADVLDRELIQARDAIEAATGRRPIGFRAPGYGAGERVLAACARTGHRYDGSCLPTPLGPVLRLLAGRLRRRVRAALSEGIRLVPGAEMQYGGCRIDPRDRLAAGWWRAGADGPALLRLPLATSPVLGLPLHASLGMMLGERRVAEGLRAIARRGRPLTWLLHGLDLLGAEDLARRLPPALLETRGFQPSRQARLDFIARILDTLQEVTELQLTEDWLQAGGGERLERIDHGPAQ